MGIDNILVKYDSPEVREKAPLKIARPGDAGMDLCNASQHRVIVPLGGSVMVNTGLSVKVPDGHVGIIKARSSTFMKKGLFIVEGVIDSGYTGPLYTIVWNPGLKQPSTQFSSWRVGDLVIEPWDRISQLLILPVCSKVILGEIYEVEEMPDTERGNKGFGSTGN